MIPLLLVPLFVAQAPVPAIADGAPIVKEAAKAPDAKWTVIRGVRGRPVKLAADKPSKWALVEEGQTCDLEPDSNGTNANFYAAIDGRFKIVAASATGEITRVVVEIGDPPPGPVPPVPVPPVPVPPAPVPPAPPKPLSPQAEKLAAALAKDGGFTDANRKSLELLEALVAASIDELQKSTTLFTDKLNFTTPPAGRRCGGRSNESNTERRPCDCPSGWVTFVPTRRANRCRKSTGRSTGSASTANGSRGKPRSGMRKSSSMGGEKPCR